MAPLFYLALLLGFRAAASGPYAPLAPQWNPPSAMEVGYYKTKKAVDNMARSHKLSQTEKVVASSCRRSVVLSEFLDVAELKLPMTEPLLGLENLKKKVTEPLSAFRLIRTTRLGRAVLKKFIPKYGTDIRIELSGIDTIQADVDGALALFDPIRSIIRIDRRAEVGMVAFVLLHEMIHSLDTDYRQAMQKQLTLRQKFELDLVQTVNKAAIQSHKTQDLLEVSDFTNHELEGLRDRLIVLNEMQDISIFRAERLAYDASYTVWKDLYEHYPAYYQEARGLASEKHEKREPVAYDDDHVVSINGLSASYIQRFKAGACKTW